MQKLSCIILPYQERKAKRLETSRNVFAEYGLHPEKNKLLDEELHSIEMKKGERYFSCGPRKCIVCGQEYFGGRNLCQECYGVYEEESLFWKQGKKL